MNIKTLKEQEIDRLIALGDIDGLVNLGIPYEVASELCTRYFNTMAQKAHRLMIGA